MNIQAALALTAALVGLAGCDSADIDAAIKRLTADDAQQAKDIADAQALLLRYAPSSSALSSSSSSQPEQPAPIVVAAAPPPPDPPREACTESVPRLYDCVDGLRYYW